MGQDNRALCALMKRMNTLVERKPMFSGPVGETPDADACPKCDSILTQKEYQKSRRDDCSLVSCKEEGDHLHRHCTTCGYRWGSPTADRRRR